MASLAALYDPLKWAYAAALASLLMIGAAHAFENLGGLYPCPLCLRQREVYWGAAGLAAAGLLVHWRWPFDRLLPTLSALLGVVFLAGAGVAAYHAGVEWGWLPAPDGCVAGSKEGLDGDLLSELTRPMATASCTEAPGRILGLSMAGWNALASLALAGLSFLASTRPATIGGRG